MATYNTCTTDEFIRTYVRNAGNPTNGDDEMAKPVKLKKGAEFNFTKKGTASKYPWNEWFNGDLLMIERSEGPENEKGTIEVPTVAKDYGVPNDAMPPKIKTAARRRYKVCETSRVDADGQKLKDAFIIRARDMTADERIAEDLKRAEEKAAMVADDDDADDNGNDAAPPATE